MDELCTAATDNEDSVSDDADAVVEHGRSVSEVSLSAIAYRNFRG